MFVFIYAASDLLFSNSTFVSIPILVQIRNSRLKSGAQQTFVNFKFCSYKILLL